jgi:hypothetical protein
VFSFQPSSTADGSDRGRGADVCEGFAVANRGELGEFNRSMQHRGFSCRAPRDQRAISIALRTISVRMCDATRHPAIILLNASMMKHT